MEGGRSFGLLEGSLELFERGVLFGFGVYSRSLGFGVWVGVGRRGKGRRRLVVIEVLGRVFIFVGRFYLGYGVSFVWRV